MAATRLTCPACNTALKLAQEVSAGQPVKCPDCGETFRPTAEDIRESAAVAAPRRSARDDDYDDSRPRRRSRGRSPSSGGSVVVVLAVLGLVLLVGGGITAAIILLTDKKPEKVAVTTGPFIGPPVMSQPSAPTTPATPPKSGGSAGGLEIGNPAMEISGEDIDGKAFKLSDYRGKVVVLDFWGNW